MVQQLKGTFVAHHHVNIHTQFANLHLDRNMYTPRNK